MSEVEAVKNESQREQVEAHLSDHGQIYADIWKVGVNVALRIGDLLQLKMDVIKIALDEADDIEPSIIINEQKTGKPRKITFNGPVVAVIKRRIKENPKDVWLFQSGASNLSRGKVQAISTRSVGRVFQKVGQRIRPRVKMGTHSMRKTHGYAMHKRGDPIERICRKLNHSTPAVTMSYIGLMQEDIDQSYIDLEL